MNANKHTPGPWNHGTSDIPGTQIAICGETPNRTHCTVARLVCSDVGEIAYGECMANARLIAAAPELLAALNGILDNNGARGKFDACALMQHTADAERTIAKATETKENYR